MLPPIAFRHQTLDWSRPYVMGVVNATPDSFSAGGRFTSVEEAVAHGLQLEADGADLIDIGGESTRPGAAPVSADVEIARVIPILEGLARRVRAVLSVDTVKAEVARAALAAGAELVNDISGGRFDPALVGVAAEAGAALVCGHVRGSTIAEVHASEDRPPTFDQVADELGERLERSAAGPAPSHHRRPRARLRQARPREPGAQSTSR